MKKTRLFTKCFFWFALATTVICLPVGADQKDDEIAALKNQIQQLRQENQSLRRMLAKSETVPVSTPPSASSNEREVSSSVSQSNETGYWMTSSSQKRHNNKCRYYKNSSGRHCGANDGIACKICGG